MKKLNRGKILELNIKSTQKLNNDLEIPRLGLGTWDLRGRRAYQAVLWSLDLGYRLIDTASLYENEIDIGEALKDRFIWIKLDFQPSEEEVLIIKQEANLDNLDGEKIAQLSQQIIHHSRNNRSIQRGSSIRGAIDLAQLISKTEEINSSMNWVNTAIMALYNKVELEDGVTSSKEEIIAEIVLSVLNKSDFQ